MHNPYEIFNKRPKCNISFGRIKRRQEVNIKVVLKKQCVGPDVNSVRYQAMPTAKRNDMNTLNERQQTLDKKQYRQLKRKSRV